MTAIEIVPITQDHIEGFHRAVDIVARERRYLAFLEAPPIESTRAFVLDNIKRGHPQFVAVSAVGEVVGWCDVKPLDRPSQAHRGVFGVGCCRDSEAGESAPGGLTVREHNTGAIELYKKAGFAIEGVQRDAVLVDGVYEDVVCMAVVF